MRASRLAPRPDPLALLLGLVMAVALTALPFVTFKASRIASGEARSIAQALPTGWAAAVALGVLAAAAVGCLARDQRPKLAVALAALLIVAVALGQAALELTPAGNRLVRIAPAAGAWLLLLALALQATSALSALAPGPLARVGWLLAALAGSALLLRLGTFEHLSVMREYAVNAGTFPRELRRHLSLALGSLAAALLVGLPLGILCQRRPPLRAGVLRLLSLIQTIPSLALFGILMVPLAALATALPWLGAHGVRGIGAAPALAALFLYSLLPVVANTVVGLEGVPAPALDAATGMGLTRAQTLAGVELPLALPTILAGIRIVLVQNIGLVTIAALIGGGGLGTFVFQGIGQTAIDLVLLGAIPIVVLSFAASVLLDALAGSLSTRRGETGRGVHA